MAKCSGPSTCWKMMRVLGDATRLRIIRALLEQGCCVGELAKRLNLGQARISHSLGILRAAGVVEGVRRGKSVVYEVNRELRPGPRTLALDIGCSVIRFRPLGAGANKPRAHLRSGGRAGRLQKMASARPYARSMAVPGSAAQGSGRRVGAGEARAGVDAKRRRNA